MSKLTNNYQLTTTNHNPKVAIVHDWLVGGGAERVVLELHRMFPEAPIYTSYCTDEWREKLDNKVVTGYLQYWPFSKLRKFLPALRIWWFTRLKFDDYDLVISSSGNGEAKGIRVRQQTTDNRQQTKPVHVCYCHTPTHFYWRHYDQYMKSPGFGIFNPLARLGLRLLVSPLRKWDLKAAQRPDYYIANSTHIQADIKNYYSRKSIVIYPPVDIERFNNLPKRERKGFVTVGRQVPFKKTNIIVEACTQLNLPLTVVGRGPDHQKLLKMAGPSVTFIATASDEAVAQHLSSAEAFLFAAEEDFGITPVEAMAAGTPVIAYKAGGALDYVVEGETGLFFEEQNVENLMGVLKKFETKVFSPETIQKHASQFSASAFRKELKKQLSQILKS